MQHALLIRSFVSTLLILFLWPFRLHAQDYEVEGTIQESIVGQPDWTNSASFIVYVRDCAWLIETRETNSSGISRHRSIGSPNGAEIFQLNSTPRNLGGAPTNRAGQRVLQVDGAIAFPNSIPFGTLNDSIIPHLWIMFASQCYFKSQNSTNRLMPIFSIDPALVGLADLRMEAEWELINSKITLPLTVVYFNAGGFHVLDAERKVEFLHYPVPYKSGFTAAKYSVSTMTNYSGVAFPSGFTFAEFRPGSGQSRYDLSVRKSARALVSAFRPTCSRKELLPPIQGQTLVRDLRLPQTEAFGYKLKKGDNWMTTAEAKKAHDRKATPPRRSPVVVAVLVTMFCLPLAAGTVYFWRRGRETS